MGKSTGEPISAFVICDRLNKHIISYTTQYHNLQHHLSYHIIYHVNTTTYHILHITSYTLSLITSHNKYMTHYITPQYAILSHINNTKYGEAALAYRLTKEAQDSATASSFCIIKGILIINEIFITYTFTHA